MVLAQLAQRAAEAAGKLLVRIAQLTHEYLHEDLEGTRKLRVINLWKHFSEVCAAPLSERQHVIAKAGEQGLRLSELASGNGASDV